LNENVAGAAENAEDFTKNFMNTLGHPMQVPINQNGAPNNLHNPAPMDKTPSFAANNSIPSNPELPVVGPGQNVSAPRRGRGLLQQQKPGMRVPMCGSCNAQIR